MFSKMVATFERMDQGPFRVRLALYAGCMVSLQALALGFYYLSWVFLPAALIAGPLGVLILILSLPTMAVLAVILPADWIGGPEVARNHLVLAIGNSVLWGLCLAWFSGRLRKRADSSPPPRCPGITS